MKPPDDLVFLLGVDNTLLDNDHISMTFGTILNASSALKERMLDEVEKRYPAGDYVMVDNKLRILAAMKEIRGDRLTTVFPRQRHYALEPKNIAAYPPADITVERIGDLWDHDRANFTARAAQVASYSPIS